MYSDKTGNTRKLVVGVMNFVNAVQRKLYAKIQQKRLHFEHTLKKSYLLRIWRVAMVYKGSRRLSRVK